jgi:hypothetical protein
MPLTKRLPHQLFLGLASLPRSKYAATGATSVIIVGIGLDGVTIACIGEMLVQHALNGSPCLLRRVHLRRGARSRLQSRPSRAFVAASNGSGVGLELGSLHVELHLRHFLDGKVDLGDTGLVRKTPDIRLADLGYHRWIGRQIVLDADYLVAARS